MRTESADFRCRVPGRPARARDVHQRGREAPPAAQDEQREVADRAGEHAAQQRAGHRADRHHGAVQRHAGRAVLRRGGLEQQVVRRQVVPRPQEPRCGVDEVRVLGHAHEKPAHGQEWHEQSREDEQPAVAAAIDQGAEDELAGEGRGRVDARADPHVRGRTAEPLDQVHVEERAREAHGQTPQEARAHEPREARIAREHPGDAAEVARAVPATRGWRLGNPRERQRGQHPERERNREQDLVPERTATRPPVQPAREQARERRGGERHDPHGRVAAREVPAARSGRHEVRHDGRGGRRARAAHEHGHGPQREDQREGGRGAAGEQRDEGHRENGQPGDAPVGRDDERLAGPQAPDRRGARQVRHDAEQVRQADQRADAVGGRAEGEGEQGHELVVEAARRLAEERVDEQPPQAGQPPGDSGPAIRSSQAAKARAGNIGEPTGGGTSAQPPPDPVERLGLHGPVELVSPGMPGKAERVRGAGRHGRHRRACRPSAPSPSA